MAMSSPAAAQVHYERLLVQEGLGPVKPLPAERLTPRLEREHQLCRLADLRPDHRLADKPDPAHGFLTAVLLRHQNRGK